MAVHVQCVLVVENETLLGAGIECMLAAETDLDVIGVMPPDVNGLLDAIRCYQPDVVILDEASPLAQFTRLLAQLPDFPSSRILIVSADDDRVQVFDRQQVLVTPTNSLATIIRCHQTVRRS